MTLDEIIAEGRMPTTDEIEAAVKAGVAKVRGQSAETETKGESDAMGQGALGPRMRKAFLAEHLDGLIATLANTTQAVPV